LGLSHAVFQLVQLVFDLLQMTERGEGRFVNCRTWLEMNVLRQESEPYSARAHNFASVRALLTTDQTKYCCLTRAIPTDQAHMLTGIDLQ
jgi:hypothetical protein